MTRPIEYESEIKSLKEELAFTRAVLRDILPLAERHLALAPSHPDNAKLESARNLLAT